MPEQKRAVSASASERQVAEYPRDVGDMLRRLREDVTVEIEEEYGDEEEAIVATSQPPHEVLGVDPDAPEPRVIQAYRDRVKEAHADQGDAPDLSVQEVKEAKEAMLG